MPVRIRLTTALLVCIAASLGSLGTARAQAPLAWSAPRLVDHVAPFGHSRGLSDVSCPSASLCVALADRGVATSGDAFSADPHWTFTPIPESPVRLACPSVSLCVAVDWQGDVISSTDPTGGPSAWKSVAITYPHPYNQALTDISCPDTTLCVAVGGSNADNVFVSTNPTGGAGDWVLHNPPDVPAGQDSPHNAYTPYSVSCPSANLCVTADQQTVGTLSEPAGSATWKVQRTSADILRLACPSSTLCIGTADGEMSVSQDPTGDGDTWQTSTSAFGASDVSCASPSLCVARSGPQVSYSTHPADGASSWSAPVTIGPDSPNVGTGSDAILAPGINELGKGSYSVTCTSDQLCAATDLYGRVLTSSNPTGAASDWHTSLAVQGADGFADMSCPSVSLCAAIDDAGRLITTRSPGKPAASWRVIALPDLVNGYAWTIQCLARPACVASDTSYTSYHNQPHVAYASLAPDAGAQGWHNLGTYQPGFPFPRRTCLKAKVCFRWAASGFTLTTPNAQTKKPACRRTGKTSKRRCPTHRRPTTRTQLIRRGPTSCPTASRLLCANINDPATGPYGSPPLVLSVSCPTAKLCVAIDSVGNVISATSATANKPWKVVPIAGADELTALACPSASRCVAADTHGNVFTTSRPRGAATAWTKTTVDPYSWITTLACPTAALCVAGDHDGKILLGTPEKAGL